MRSNKIKIKKFQHLKTPKVPEELAVEPQFKSTEKEMEENRQMDVPDNTNYFIFSHKYDEELKITRLENEKL